MKPLVIYHADCTDGYGAAFAAWMKLGDEAEYLPMNYKPDALKDVVYEDREVYVLDFSFDRETMDNLFDVAKRVVWLDHHKTAFEMWCGENYTHPQDENIHTEDEGNRFIILHSHKSGALLAWEYFHSGTEVPMLIQHIDDRDRWQWKLDGSAEIHAALGSMKPWSFEQWKAIISCKPPNANVEYLRNQGTAILRAQKQHVERMAKQARKCGIPPTVATKECYAPGSVFEPMVGLAVNAPIHQSEVGHELANQSGTYGLVWYLGSDNRARCSLRSNGDYDVSAIARAFGGGGHKNASGMEVDVETLLSWLR